MFVMATTSRKLHQLFMMYVKNTEPISLFHNSTIYVGASHRVLNPEDFPHRVESYRTMGLLEGFYQSVLFQLYL